MKRREFIAATTAAYVGSVVGTGIASTNAFDVEEATVASLQSAMQTGEITARALVSTYIDRIASGDKATNSIIEMNPDALAIAATLDAERKAGKVRGPLHGIPVVLKDNIDTADKMKTTAGSLALLDAPTPKRDAFLVEQLRRAGAVVLAKTNLSEWANFRSTASTSGWSGRGGQTRNPYILDRNPCGSSSGTGAAIAANFSAIGIGTETDGSIVCPSSICGIVGLKPTVGLISRSGVIPISASQDTAGPMTRTVADAAAMLSAMTAVDASDPATAKNSTMARTDYETFLKPDGLKGAVIGVARDYWGKRAEVDAITDAALDAMKKAGATLVDVKFAEFGKFDDAEFEVLQFEFKDGLAKYLAGRGSQYKNLDDLIKFNNDNAAREMPYFKQEIFEKSAKKGLLTSKEYLDARALCIKLTREIGIDAAMNKDKLDAIVAPSNAPTWMTDLVNGDCGSNYISSSSMAAISGYPSITVPAGFLHELPIGISFFGRAYSEPVLIRVAYAFEQMTKARRKPKFLATAA
ncbi:MAG: amidase [Acidobacteria bacterium]|nr:MAG: amidase [Acidobacteriota bacterium]